MLAWLQNNPGAETEECVEHASGRGPRTMAEPPETPAPVFAIRALRAAFFGTPKEDPERTVLDPDRDAQRQGAAADTAQETSRRAQEDSDPRIPQGAATTCIGGSAMSPTKPTGILLTPGTGANRRKTVSFGEAVVDSEGRPLGNAGKSGLPETFPGKFPSPWTPKTTGAGSRSQRTTLTQSLFSVRNPESAEKSISTNSSELVKPGAKKGRQDAERRSARRTNSQRPKSDEDATIDMNDPRSSSGQYWKSEYEEYQAKANEQMRKVMKYKDLAKSFAKKKDTEAIDLGKKLREEKQKVAKMEQELASLAGQVVSERLGEGNDGSRTPDMIKELARQTSLALQYRSNVDQFEDALAAANVIDTENGNADLPDTSSTLHSLTEARQQLKVAKAKIEEMGELRTRSELLEKNLKTAEKRASALEREKSKLVADISRMRESFDESEKKRNKREEKQKSRIEQLETESQEYRHKLLEARSGREMSPVHPEKDLLTDARRPSPRPTEAAASNAVNEARQTPNRKRRATSNAPVDHGLSEEPSFSSKGGADGISAHPRASTARRHPDQVPALQSFLGATNTGSAQERESTGARVMREQSRGPSGSSHLGDLCEWSPVDNDAGRPKRQSRTSSPSKTPKTGREANITRELGPPAGPVLADVNVNSSYDKLPAKQKNKDISTHHNVHKRYEPLSPQPNFDSLTFDLPSPEPFSDTPFQVTRPSRSNGSSPKRREAQSVEMGGFTGHDENPLASSPKGREVATSKRDRTLPPERAQAARARLEKKKALRSMDSQRRLA